MESSCVISVHIHQYVAGSTQTGNSTSVLNHGEPISAADIYVLVFMKKRKKN